MNNVIKYSLTFVAGFASGCAAAYFVAAHYFGLEWVDEPETNDIPSEYDDKNQDDVVVNDSSYPSIEDNDEFYNYSKVYVKESDDEQPPQEIEIFDEKDANKVPIVIDEKEYGTDFDYDEICLKFYEKELLLTDDWDYPIENIEGTVGSFALNLLVNSDSDVIYIQNDRLKAYYEITRQIIDYPGNPDMDSEHVAYYSEQKGKHITNSEVI